LATEQVVDTADITIGVDVIGRYRELFPNCIEAAVEALILLEAGGFGESILVEIKSELVGRTSEFKKTLEKVSAIIC